MIQPGIEARETERERNDSRTRENYIKLSVRITLFISVLDSLCVGVW